MWQQVLNDLRDRLAKGEFDQSFPNDRELMATYAVSRHTVRETTRRLQAEGVLLRHKGRGSFVKALSLVQPTGPLYSLFRSIEDQGHVQRSNVLRLEAVHDEVVAARLGLSPLTRFFFLRRVRRADDLPFAVDEIWIPASIAEPLFTVDFEHTAVYAELE